MSWPPYIGMSPSLASVINASTLRANTKRVLLGHTTISDSLDVHRLRREADPFERIKRKADERSAEMRRRYRKPG